MLTVFTENGEAFAATVITATPNVVTQIKTKEKDGNNAVQLGAVEKKEKQESELSCRSLYAFLSRFIPSGSGWGSATELELASVLVSRLCNDSRTARSCQGRHCMRLQACSYR